MNRALLVGGGAATFAGSAFLSYIATRAKPQAGDAQVKIPEATERVKTYDNIASSYDAAISWDETVMGVFLLRRWLASKAAGDVLEVATGTGRNHKYYDKVRL